ncbi:MAG: tRNA 2-thiouridine(34) synthase MnmA [Pseudomonadota bacterium]
MNDAALNSLDLPGRPQDNRIVVAMSGGVDSSVTAALLAREGYDVVGMTLQLYDHGAAIHRKGACCAGQDIHDARRVAESLGIPHYVLDYESRFRNSVIEEFADAYARGETPIPCVSCNQTVKFTDLLGMARQLGAAALATGHYIASEGGRTGRRLVTARDASKDQSYFLFATTQEQLDFVRFPLGRMTKDEVRAIALDMGLIVAEKPDSQDICFVPSGRYTDIVEKLRPDAARAGDIVHIDGRVLGHHDGVLRYTVGQRRGLGIPAPEPLYVVRLDAARAEVVVGPREALLTTDVRLRDVNWLGDGALADLPDDGLDILVRVRSTRPPRPARLHCDADGAMVVLADGEHGVSPGQACVFYEASEGDAMRVLGGGWIARTDEAVPLAAAS